MTRRTKSLKRKVEEKVVIVDERESTARGIWRSPALIGPWGEGGAGETESILKPRDPRGCIAKMTELY